MFLATLGVSVLLGRIGRGRAFLAIPAAIAVIAAGSRVLLAIGVGWIYPALWLLRGASEFLLGMAVWGLAGLVTDTRQAKRFFPLIGGAAVMGQVLGGLATRPLAGWLGAENLILVWLGTLVLVVALARTLVMAAGAAVRPPRRRRPSAVAEMRDGLRQALRSPLLRWMSVGSVLFSLLFFSLYLPFSRAAVARYPRPDRSGGVPRAVPRRVHRGDPGPVAPRDEPPPVEARDPDRDDGPARALSRGLRGAHGGLHVRDPARLPVRPGGLAPGWCHQRVGGGDRTRSPAIGAIGCEPSSTAGRRRWARCSPGS